MVINVVLLKSIENWMFLGKVQKEYHYCQLKIQQLQCESCTTTICVFERQTLGNIDFNVLGWPIWNFDWNCIRICVYAHLFFFVYLYLHIRQMGTLFLRSSYHYIFENIAYVRRLTYAILCKCGIVFCVYVFACQTNGNFVFEVFIPLPFQY